MTCACGCGSAIDEVNKVVHHPGCPKPYVQRRAEPGAPGLVALIDASGTIVGYTQGPRTAAG